MCRGMRIAAGKRVRCMVLQAHDDKSYPAVQVAIVARLAAAPQQVSCCHSPAGKGTLQPYSFQYSSIPACWATASQQHVVWGSYSLQQPTLMCRAKYYVHLSCDTLHPRPALSTTAGVAQGQPRSG